MLPIALFAVLVATRSVGQIRQSVRAQVAPSTTQGSLIASSSLGRETPETAEFIKGIHWRSTLQDLKLLGGTACQSGCDGSVAAELVLPGQTLLGQRFDAVHASFRDAQHLQRITFRMGPMSSGDCDARLTALWLKLEGRYGKPCLGLWEVEQGDLTTYCKNVGDCEGSTSSSCLQELGVDIEPYWPGSKVESREGFGLGRWGMSWNDLARLYPSGRLSTYSDGTGRLEVDGLVFSDYPVHVVFDFFHGGLSWVAVSTASTLEPDARSVVEREFRERFTSSVGPPARLDEWFTPESEIYIGGHMQENETAPATIVFASLEIGRKYRIEKRVKDEPGCAMYRPVRLDRFLRFTKPVSR